MRLVKGFVIFIALILVAAFWYKSQYPNQWDQLLYPMQYEGAITKASKQYHIDPYLICGIIYVESKFGPGSESSAGAIGLMQVMPETGKWISKTRKISFEAKDLYDPETNIDIGSWYFSHLMKKYNDERLALAAYNAGYTNVDKWLQNTKYQKNNSIEDMVEKIPFSETKGFICKVDEARKTYARIYPHYFDNNTNADSKY